MFDDENNIVKFGGDWKSFCNARQLYVGKGITMGTSALGGCATLYCTFDVDIMFNSRDDSIFF